MFTYKINNSIDLGKAVAPVNSVIERLNTILATYGCNDKLSMRAKMFSIDVKVSRILTTNERKQFMTVIEKAFNEVLPEYGIKVESMRRKPSKSSYKSISKSKQ